MESTKVPATKHVPRIEDDPRWGVLINRQADVGDDFVYGVLTTGIYCGPRSPTKLPRPENVVFFDTAIEAEAAGFRPSKRRDSNQETIALKHAATVAETCRMIDASDSVPNLSDMAEKVGMSTFHFHRIFKKITGLTPKAYSVASVRSRVRDQLSQSGTITSALYEAGYNSNSRFYEASQKILGMKPTEYRAGGANVDIKFALGESSLGSILVAKSARGICAILLGDDPNSLVESFQDQFPNANLIGGDAEFEGLVSTVVGFVESPAVGLALPLDIRGTVFQERVWQALRDIPAGSTATYTDIAVRIGMPSAVRAVANACGANSLAVAIPCHRVVRSDGTLSGYRWGVERKRKLLEREKMDSPEELPLVVGSIIP
ncbi:bifunctional DNA-binding transcriptional regulator/O6-methylguanine-DNA methyltransferase Ada [Pseudomonas sp. CCI3.2]|uniref:bifunctional DNA-binding transcriptional regulator/O6-methylguanine-DNA methyltransferase Ada n=1 Tax=unclassified Pseudomonas TaxID=196821 RepID=UPI002AC8F712|nr:MULTISPECIES: bifunctional DNA-binding transcriptional regulator/O6-methylguanine-DNA methyltransferase Ada [unclassified Pseudomonas]MEB0077790.1 bifunctional DNA-binding transcriptional regulator/O6-methylguanine-DNA methyltransferase Ada [Pseudomonas sp. MH10out]MEB0103081.1 bifunctional DNA-binding transcriptional regulator/O6-methylguanine-DNA methyltransferase Ada [Pseudomonas sp. CCI3.2]MEB0130796.1 bifunctional DNA-binding transcriptional regulator/O6-methylguanine-DNA methyltransfera